MGEVVQRAPTTAAVLSLVTPGLGQLYNGQPARAIIFYLVGFVIAFASGLYWLATFRGLIVSLIVIAGFRLIVLLEAFFGARSIEVVLSRAFNRWYVYAAIIVVNGLAITPLARSTLVPFRAYRLATDSMAPTLTVGDLVMVDKWAYEHSMPTRGDLVLCERPGGPPAEHVRRVLGIPGDVLSIRDGTVYVNDHPVDEPYVRHLDGVVPTGGESSRTDLRPTPIPAGHLFVMADNRDASTDSRFRGPVSLGAVRGRVLYLYWSKDTNRIGTKPGGE